MCIWSIENYRKSSNIKHTESISNYSWQGSIQVNGLLGMRNLIARSLRRMYYYNNISLVDISRNW